MKIGIASIFKNEFDYILEWIAYHRVKGIKTFYIADNVSTDGTSELLQALDYLGYIKRIYFPRIADQGPQAPAYNHILEKYGCDVDLLAFIDADEFIYSDVSIEQNVAIKMFYGNNDLSAMALNWKIYGSSGVKIPKSYSVLSEYKFHSTMSDPNNNHIKSLVKPSKIEKVNIHDCILKSGAYCNSSLGINIFDEGLENFPKTKIVNYENIHINHYVTKSNIEHFVKKINKGSAAGSASRKKGLSYFKAHDRNDVCSPFDNGFLELLQNEIIRIRDDVNNCIHFMSVSYGHIDIDCNKGILSGWVSDSNLDFVRVVVNNKEYILKVCDYREDVYSKNLSNGPCCGFKMKVDIVDSDIIEAYVYGSSIELSQNKF